MTKWIWSYDQNSKGSKALADRMGIKRLKVPERSKFNGGPDKDIINWGSSTVPEKFLGGRVFNKPEHVAQMTNKKLAFEVFRDHSVSVPTFTSDYNAAKGWAQSGRMVFARTILQGHSGAGIHIMDPEHPDTWDVRAQLFTMYVKKKEEFRVHICNGNIFLVQRKGLKQEFAGQPDVNHLIRNLANGFAFVRNEVVVPEDVKVQALKAWGASQLDFGAVDVIWNERSAKAYVLEINTAPGLVNSSVDDYAEALGKL